MQASRYVARFDSASSTLQVIANYLCGKDFPGLGITRYATFLFPLVNALQANPELALYQMHDPNQDRLMSQIMAYFRVKRLRLGAMYEQFIEDTVPPGGTLILLECQLSAYRYALPDAVPLEQVKAFLRQTASRYAVTWCEYEPS
jgi:hypothetical protein